MYRYRNRNNQNIANPYQCQSQSIATNTNNCENTPKDYNLNQGYRPIVDYGKYPYVFDINSTAKNNTTFRTAVWTGTNLQVTVMHLNPGEEIGAEIHYDVDQFLRVEQGTGLVLFGTSNISLNHSAPVCEGYAILVPAGTWHNIINTGTVPLKMYSIYSPPQHPKGTVHVTKADSDAAEHNY